MSKLEFNKRMTEIWIYPKINKLQDEYASDPNFMDFMNTSGDGRQVRLYVHFPFCNSFCFFCPYYKVRYDNLPYEEKVRFIDNLIKEIDIYSTSEYFKNKTIVSLYIGGGDPALVELELLDRVMKKIYESFDLSACKSVTFEGHVWSLNNDMFLDWFKAIGGTRISFGIQTFKESLRKKLFLKPSEAEIFQLVDKFRSKGLDDYTFDMIYNFPDQSVEDVEIDAYKSLKLAPMNIDIHNCNVYPNTAFADAIEGNEYFTDKPTNEKETEMYQRYSSIFRENGYKHIHAISFSKQRDVKYPGFEEMMRGVPHVGFGPSGRSYLSDHSFRNITSLKEYNALLSEGKLPIEAGCISTEREKLERIMVFFPIFGWISKKEIPADEIIHNKINTLIESGFAYYDGEILRLKEEGLLEAGNLCRFFTSDDYQIKYMEGFVKCIRENLNPYNQDTMGISAAKIKQSQR